MSNANRLLLYYAMYNDAMNLIDIVEIQVSIPVPIYNHADTLPA